MRFWFGLLLFLCCGLSSCERRPSPLNAWMQKNGKPKILSTTGIVDSLVREIGKDKFDYLVLIRGDIDPHSYELVKGDGEKFVLADCIFYSGLGLEHSASLRYLIEQHQCATSLGKAICEACPQQIIWIDGQVDPHIWMDISLWSFSLDAIVETLSKKMPDEGAFFAQNAQILRDNMLTTHARLLSQMGEIPQEHRFLVTSHDAFNYFARAYLATAEERDSPSLAWKERFSSPEGLAPDGQLSTADIQRVMEHIQRYHIEVLFLESNVSPDSLKKIAHACGRRGQKVHVCLQKLYADAIGEESSYLEMISRDVSILVEEWRRP